MHTQHVWPKAPILGLDCLSGDMRRVASLGMVVLAVGFFVACSPLEPLDEPVNSDLQLTMDTLKTSLRDAHRTIAELRVEVDSRRQELADLQIARAQLEGRVREAERRLLEARHVIDLQREELAGSRSDRERASRTGAILQSQLKHLRSQIAGMGSPTDRPSVAGRQTSVAAARFDQSDALPERTTVVGRQAPYRREKPSIDGASVPRAGSANPLRVLVRSGDTLWSIAQRHRVSLKRLIAINQLSDNYIQVGQTLWLVEPPVSGAREYEAAE